MEGTCDLPRALDIPTELPPPLPGAVAAKTKAQRCLGLAPPPRPAATARPFRAGAAEASGCEEKAPSAPARPPAASVEPSPATSMEPLPASATSMEPEASLPAAVATDARMMLDGMPTSLKSSYISTSGAVPMDPSQRKRYRQRVRYIEMAPDQREIYLQRNRDYKRMKRAASASSGSSQSITGDTSMSTNGNIHLPIESSRMIEGKEIAVTLLQEQDVPSSSSKNLEIVAQNIASTVRCKCSHDGCGSLLGYEEVHGHELACTHGRCTCTEPGCNFTGPPAALLVHLATDHLINVRKFSYGLTKVFQEQVPVPGSPCRRFIGEGEDGAVFLFSIRAVGLATIVSVVCVRSASCVWPVYTVMMRANVPPSSSDVVRVTAEVSSSASPGTVEFEELTSFLRVPQGYLVGAGASKQLHFSICIGKKSRS